MAAMADIGNREYHCSVSCYKYIKKNRNEKPNSAQAEVAVCLRATNKRQKAHYRS